MMAGIRRRLDDMTQAEAELLAASAYCAGYLLVWGWERWERRRRIAAQIDRELQQMAADFRSRLDGIKVDAPRPDAEREGG